VLADDGHRIAADMPVDQKRAVLQLSRLETLTDVIYALVLWRFFQLLPRPTQEDWGWSNMTEFLQDELSAFIGITIGLAFTIIYWLQNNVLMGNLLQTDGRHTALSIVQLFFLLVFLLVIGLGTTLEPSPVMRLLESGSAAMVGISAAWAWSYAIKQRRLLLPEVTEEDALGTRDRITAEPLTALFTLPFAFFPWLWELAWFSYPAMIRLVRRRRHRSPGGTS
jgi:hypothetical protein